MPFAPGTRSANDVLGLAGERSKCQSIQVPYRKGELGAGPIVGLRLKLGSSPQHSFVRDFMMKLLICDAERENYFASCNELAWDFDRRP
jgi:hypothetical protein